MLARTALQRAPLLRQSTVPRFDTRALSRASTLTAAKNNAAASRRFREITQRLRKPPGPVAQMVHRFDHDPFGAVNTFMAPDGTAKHSQKSFVDDEGRLRPPGTRKNVVAHVRGKPEDKRESGLTSFSTVPQPRYIPPGRATFMLSAVANALNSFDQPHIQRVIEGAEGEEMDRPESDAAKDDVGVPRSETLTHRQKLQAWSARDREQLLFPRAKIAQIHRLVPRKTATPPPAVLARLGLPSDASWSAVEEARAKRQGKPFDPTTSFETHRKIRVTDKTLARVRNALQKKRERELRAQLRTLHKLEQQGKMSSQDAQRNREAILREHATAAKRMAQASRVNE